jgi:hypothetical protein
MAFDRSIEAVFAAVATTQSQTITFANPGSRVINQGALTLSATASSGLDVVFTSQTSSVCTVSGVAATFLNAGTCTIAANQAGNSGFSAAPQVSQSFQVTLPPLVALSKRGGIDLDGLGLSALVMRTGSNSTQAARLVNGVFQFSSLPDPGPNYRLVGIGDFDGDGKSDLAFQEVVSDPDFGNVTVWPNYSSTGAFLLRRVKKVWDVQAVGDLDGDGLGDLVWRYVVSESPDTGVSYIWFTKVGDPTPVNQVRKRGGAPLTWTLLGAADLNYDGAADMVYVSPDKVIRVLMATANRTCANFGAGNVPSGYSVLKFADFTGNRRGDILIRNATTGDTQLLSLNASGMTLPVYAGDPNDPNASCSATTVPIPNTSIGLPTTPTTWQFYASGDFNGDGINDIVWKQPNGTLTVWLMSAGGAAQTVINNAGSAPVGSTIFQP